MHSCKRIITSHFVTGFASVCMYVCMCVCSCDWQLPEWLRIILQELGNPKNSVEFRTKTREWFKRIDINLNKELDEREIREEFGRLKQTKHHADFFLKHFDADNNKALSVDEFEAALIHSVGTSIPGLSVMDVIALWSLFLLMDINGDGLMVSWVSVILCMSAVQESMHTCHIPLRMSGCLGFAI
jgi:hypothetical protein